MNVIFVAKIFMKSGADPEGVWGGSSESPWAPKTTHCMYLSSNDFWPAEPLPDENTS